MRFGKFIRATQFWYVHCETFGRNTILFLYPTVQIISNFSNGGNLCSVLGRDLKSLHEA